jgi:hypothetical protein
VLLSFLNSHCITLAECKTNYHHNFRVFEGQRTYYTIVTTVLPDIIQVGEHQFVETKVINLWINMMLLSWTSATNCARLYNLAIGQHPLPVQNTPIPWQFSLAVTSDQVYDGFTILSLLKDCQLRRQILTVPHGGPAKERFKVAVQARNNRMWLYGQPELRHHCLTCTRFFDGKHLLIYHFSDGNLFSVLLVQGTERYPLR